MRWLPLLAVLAGCKELRKMKDLKELLPEVHFNDLKVDDIDFRGLEGKFVLDVTNPYPVALDLAETNWKLGLAGSPFLDGTNEKGLSIAATETSKVRLPFSLRWADAFAVVAGAKGQDTLPYDLEADLTFNTPIGRVNVPVKHKGEMPALHAPRFSLQGLRVENIDLGKQQATIAVDLGMRSNQGSTLTFEAFEYGLKLAGHEVASGTARLGGLDEERTVTLPIDVKLLGLGEAAVDALVHKRPVKVRLTGDASVGTPFGVVPFAFDESADLTPR